jgi:DNA-binding transcriptional MerR regulator/DNA-binding MarR family transcriptional regulator
MTATMRIGELAEATGLTVRALRHYEAVGLLEPVARSESGYRRFDADDAERLYAIVALRRLGLSLAEIRAIVAAEPAELAETLDRHLTDVRAQTASLAELESVLHRVRRELGASRNPSLADLCDLVRMTVELPRRDLADEPQALQVLAEPLSGPILERLQRRGPATAADLSRSLGEPARSVSMQLDRLAAHGFVEEDPGRSRPRTRRWRIVVADLRLPQVERTEESDRIARSWFEPALAALARFVERRGDAWAGSATLSHAALTLTQEELELLGAEYVALVQRYARPVEDAPEDARPATALMFAFPLEDA